MDVRVEKRSNKSLKTTIPIIGGMKQDVLSRQVRSLTGKWRLIVNRLMVLALMELISDWVSITL